jgi:hypothetical protein
MLTQNEIDILSLSVVRNISIQELQERFPFKPTIEEVRYYLDQSLGAQPEPDFETLWELTYLVDKESDKVLHREYLLREGHYQHENMARAFQTYFNEDAASILILVKAISQVPAYLDDSDSTYPYIRKLIYAIGAQPEPYNLQALEELGKSEDKEIKDLALHQLEKRKEGGRWEQRNKQSK